MLPIRKHKEGLSPSENDLYAHTFQWEGEQNKLHSSQIAAPLSQNKASRPSHNGQRTEDGVDHFGWPKYGPGGSRDQSQMNRPQLG